MAKKTDKKDGIKVAFTYNSGKITNHTVEDDLDGYIRKSRNNAIMKEDPIIYVDKTENDGTTSRIFNVYEASAANNIVKASSKKDKWVMPSQLEKFRSSIVNTGGNSIEDLMNDKGTTLFNNAPRSLIICCVSSQINLLERLTREGKI